MTTPAFTVVVPLKVFDVAPLSVSVPAPAFVIPPAPLSALAIVTLLLPRMPSRLPPLLTLAPVMLRSPFVAFHACAAPSTSE